MHKEIVLAYPVILELRAYGNKDTSVSGASDSKPLRRSSCQSTSIPSNTDPIDYDKDLGAPGEFPFTRGIYSNMYRSRLWTMRQYAGYASAEESNARYKYLAGPRDHRALSCFRFANSNWFGLRRSSGHRAKSGRSGSRLIPSTTCCGSSRAFRSTPSQPR